MEARIRLIQSDLNTPKNFSRFCFLESKVDSVLPEFPCGYFRLIILKTSKVRNSRKPDGLQ